MLTGDFELRLCLRGRSQSRWQAALCKGQFLEQTRGEEAGVWACGPHGAGVEVLRALDGRCTWGGCRLQRSSQKSLGDPLAHIFFGDKPRYVCYLFTSFKMDLM